MAAVAVNDEEILKYAVSEGIISLDDVRKSMELKEKKITKATSQQNI